MANPELPKVYEQLCQSYRAIDDFRAKLLGFLPLASVSGAFLLLKAPETIEFAKPFLKPLGLFGFVVTLGLFFYEIYGIRKCRVLINAGQKIECSLGITDGQFLQRPDNVLYLINEPFAAGVIYPAVLAGWMFLALVVFPQPLQPDQPPAIEAASTDAIQPPTIETASIDAIQPPRPEIDAALTTAIWVFAVGFLITLIYNLVLPLVDKSDECKKLKEMEKATKSDC